MGAPPTLPADFFNSEEQKKRKLPPPTLPADFFHGESTPSKSTLGDQIVEGIASLFSDESDPTNPNNPGHIGHGERPTPEGPLNDTHVVDQNPELLKLKEAADASAATRGSTHFWSDYTPEQHAYFHKRNELVNEYNKQQTNIADVNELRSLGTQNRSDLPQELANKELARLKQPITVGPTPQGLNPIQQKRVNEVVQERGDLAKMDADLAATTKYVEEHPVKLAAESLGNAFGPGFNPVTTVEGPFQLAKGIHEAATSKNKEESYAGGHKAIEGLGNTLEPLNLLLLENPGAFVKMIAAQGVAEAAGTKTAQALGADREAQDITGAISGLAAGPLVGLREARRGREYQAAVAEYSKTAHARLAELGHDVPLESLQRDISAALQGQNPSEILEASKRLGAGKRDATLKNLANVKEATPITEEQRSQPVALDEIAAQSNGTPQEPTEAPKIDINNLPPEPAARERVLGNDVTDTAVNSPESVDLALKNSPTEHDQAKIAEFASSFHEGDTLPAAMTIAEVRAIERMTGLELGPEGKLVKPTEVPTPSSADESFDPYKQAVNKESARRTHILGVESPKVIGEPERGRVNVEPGNAGPQGEVAAQFDERGNVRGDASQAADRERKTALDQEQAQRENPLVNDRRRVTIDGVNHEVKAITSDGIPIIEHPTPKSEPEKVAQSSDTTPEKAPYERTDHAKRLRIDQMSHEEARKALQTDEKSGVQTERAYNDAESVNPSPFKAYSDVDGLGAMNDNKGHDAGDQLLSQMGAAFKEAGLDSYRIGGDEVIHRGESPEELRAKLDKAREIFAQKVIEVTAPDGTIDEITGHGFSYGIGKTKTEADAELYRDKRRRETAGSRPKKGDLAGVSQKRLPAGVGDANHGPKERVVHGDQAGQQEASGRNQAADQNNAVEGKGLGPSAAFGKGNADNPERGSFSLRPKKSGAEASEEVGNLLDKHVAEKRKGLHPVANRAATAVAPAKEKTVPMETDLKSFSTTLNSLQDSILKHIGDVKATGTIQPKEARPEFSATGKAPDKYKVSPESMQRTADEFHRTGEELQRLRKLSLGESDQGTQNELKLVEDRFKKVVEEFRKARAAWARTGHTMQRAIPDFLASEMKDLGISVGKLKPKERQPLLVQLRDVLREIKDEGFNSDRIFRLGDIPLQYLRTNLFPITSFTLDAFTNSVHAATEVPAALGGDIYALAKGDYSFAQTAGILRAVREIGGGSAADLMQFKGLRKVNDRAERELQTHTAAGEYIGPLGIHQVAPKVPKILANGMEELITLPVTMKGGIDALAKRTFFLAESYNQAVQEANKLNLKGPAREQFVSKFVNDMPEAAFKRAIEAGNRAGFNKNLSGVENRIASNRAVQLLLDSYPRWTFQFTRWMGDRLGLDTEFFSKVKSGKVEGRDVATYLARSATGWGGVLLAAQTLYNNVDFNTMEYVDENGNRARLNGRTPIPEALFVAAVLKGDVERAASAAQYTSFPAKWLDPDGGIASGILSAFSDMHKGTIDGERFRKEMVDLLNRAIPGQALLSTMFGVFGDGTRREGILHTGKPVINSTTGDADKPRQKILGIELPQIGGVAIPGAVRLLNPVEKALLSHGIGVFRPRRTPLAEFAPVDVPPELRDQYERAAGKLVNEYVTDVIDDPEFADLSHEERRKELQSAVSRAREDAKSDISGDQEAPHQPTLRERLAPLHPIVRFSR